MGQEGRVMFNFVLLQEFPVRCSIELIKLLMKALFINFLNLA